MKRNSRLLVLSALFAALTCVVTMALRIPSPFKGYLNLGDAMVLLCGWFLPLPYCALSAGLGAALADLFSGYPVYIPATFLIKAGMALLTHCLPRKKRFLSGLIAAALMPLGYFAFEALLYGLTPALPNLLPNALQGLAGLVLSLSIARILDKTDLLH